MQDELATLLRLLKAEEDVVQARLRVRERSETVRVPVADRDPVVPEVVKVRHRPRK